MVDIKIDGIWCKKCKALHPTLMWHEKYDDYELNKDKVEEDIKKHFSNYDLKTNRSKILKIKELCIQEEQKPCNICGCKTFFTNMKTSHYVCSDECKYIDDERIKK